MRRFASVFLVIFSFFGWHCVANAAVRIDVNLASQTMHVTANDGVTYDWSISSARPGYVTPRGTFHPQSLQAMHYSKKYHMSPMPHSIFFRGGYAIHGGYSAASMGRPASHGCVRLTNEHAATLFALVKQQGASIQIFGAPPSNVRYAKAKQKHVHLAVRHHGKQFAKAHRRHERLVAGAHLKHHHKLRGLAYAAAHHHKGASVHQFQSNPALTFLRN